MEGLLQAIADTQESGKVLKLLPCLYIWLVNGSEHICMVNVAHFLLRVGNLYLCEKGAYRYTVKLKDLVEKLS